MNIYYYISMTCMLIAFILMLVFFTRSRKVGGVRRFAAEELRKYDLKADDLFKFFGGVVTSNGRWIPPDRGKVSEYDMQARAESEELFIKDLKSGEWFRVYTREQIKEIAEQVLGVNACKHLLKNL